MVTVTKEAKKELKTILENNSKDPEVCIRLRLEPPSKLSMGLDKVHAEDDIIEDEGQKLMVVSKELINTLDGLILDVEDTEKERKLVVRKSK